MNTYRIYILSTAAVESPTVEMVYVQATKYGDAWTGARAILAKKEEAKDRNFFSDAGCTKKWALPKVTDDLTVVKALDCTPRNKKLDKATLADILADTTLSAEDRLAKITALSK